MRVLYCGDVVGRAGRRVVCERIPQIRRHLDLDFVIVNGENAAHGFGITPDMCREFYGAGVDVVTTGNHVWDRRELLEYIDQDDRLLRPLNYPEGTPGLGANVYPVNGGARRVMVLQVMGRLFMDALDDPFAAAERALRNHRLGHLGYWQHRPYASAAASPHNGRLRGADNGYGLTQLGKTSVTLRFSDILKGFARLVG